MQGAYIIKERMGRGNRTLHDLQLEAALEQPRPSDAQEQQDLLAKQDKFLSRWEWAMNKALEGEDLASMDLEELLSARSRGLRALTYAANDQRMLVLINQECNELLDDPNISDNIQAMARKNRNRAREMFILCHRGHIERFIAAHVQRFDSEDTAGAKDVLRQACDIGMQQGMDRYDFSQPANPLTYATRWMQAEIKSEAEQGRLIRLKSRRNPLADKIERLCKEIEMDGRQVSIAELAESLGEKPETVAEVLPYARRNTTRLDAPAQSDESDSIIGDLIEDTRQKVEGDIANQDMEDKLYQALDSLPVRYRRVVEVAFGIGSGADVEQKDLFDGVYVDKKGNAYSAKSSIISERAKRGEKVQKASQRELNEKFSSGELGWEPGNPEAHRLATGDDATSPQEVERLVTSKTGVPPTSGTVQDTLRKGMEMLSRHPALSGLGMRYRGDDELENSEQAREEVRSALLGMGVIKKNEMSSLQSQRSATGSKSKLRVLAEKHGLVDPATGRINTDNLPTNKGA